MNKVALFSKEQGLLLPPMLYGLWRLRRPQIPPSPAETRAARVLLLLVVFTLAAYVAYRDHIVPWYWETNLLDSGTQPMIVSGPRDRALIPLALVGRPPRRVQPSHAASDDQEAGSHAICHGCESTFPPRKMEATLAGQLRCVTARHQPATSPRAVGAVAFRPVGDCGSSLSTRRSQLAAAGDR